MKYLAVIALLVFCSFAYAQNSAVLSFYVGNVDVKSATSPQWTKAKLNMTLKDDSVIRTGQNSQAQIKLADGTIYKVQSKSVVKVKDILGQQATKTKDDSLFSKLSSIKEKLAKGGNNNLSSVSAVAGVRGADVSKQDVASAVKASDLYWEE